MQFKETVGIDVSKKTLDVFIHRAGKYKQFENEPKGIKSLIKWIFKNVDCSKEELLAVFEHTGMYSERLMVILAEQDIVFSAVSGLEIKRSMGLSRDKSDKADAKKIARFAYRLKEELKPSSLPSNDIVSIKRLLTLRERLVRQRAGFKTSYKEWKRVLTQKDNRTLFETQKRMIKVLTKEIEKVEKRIDEIIEGNHLINNLYSLITSITGVGPQTALYMIVFTDAFTKFKTWRKFACYCGIAPFNHTSGTSVRGRTRVSPLANKKIKSLLDQCAKTSVLHNPEMKIYYERRLKEGKSKMSTINIIRNKILSRIYAVVRRGTPYVNTLKFAA